jgi:mono/diheme cytochrome c family protein
VRSLAVAATAGVALALLCGRAHAGVDVVDSLELAAYADAAAVGLAVPGAGPTVTRRSALNTLLTGEARSSLAGGTPRGEPLLLLGEHRSDEPRVLVVLPPAGESDNDRRYPIVVIGAGRGLLTSESTRIPGLVSLADVARGELDVARDDDPLGTLATLDRRIEHNDGIRLPLTALAVALVVLTALAAPRHGPRVILVALAANLWLAGWWLTAAAVLAAALLPLGVASAAILAAYAVVLWREPTAVALSPLGPSQAGRFYGLSNLLETMLLLPALLGAQLLGRAGIVVAALAVVTVGASGLGADGGGLLVLLAAYATLAARSRGVHVTAARAVLGAVAVVAMGALLVALDAATGGESHVTSALSGGPGDLAGDAVRRLEIGVHRLSGSALPLVVAVLSVVALAWMATRRPRSPIVDAALVGVVVSLLVNDTPTDVLPVGAAVTFALQRWNGSPSSPADGLFRLPAMRRSTLGLLLVLAALMLVAAGCSEGTVTATPETVVGEVPTTGDEGDCTVAACELQGDAAAGEAIFTGSSGCGGCHTLAAAGTTGTVGPNLDDAKPSFELAATTITNGRGGMPTFGGQLSDQEIADVAQYVADSTSG